MSDYLGRYLKGDVVPVEFTTKNASGVPTVPDAVPSAIVYDGDGVVTGFQVPAHDQLVLTGFFLYPLFLGGDYAAGNYRVLCSWVISSTNYAEEKTFEVVAAGHRDGPGLALSMFSAPSGAEYALMHLRSGRVKKHRNPRPL
jgi:hypothetical protein